MDRHHLLRASSTLVGALALTSVLGGTALAETPSPGEHEPTNTVTFSPLPLALNREIDLEYEHALNDDVSLFAGPSFIVGSTSACSCSFSAYGGTFGARLFAGRAPSGVFVGIFGTALYASASVNGSSASVSGLAYEAGGMLGYTFIVAGHVDLSLGVGAAYANEQLTLTAPGGSFTVGADGVVPALRLALGAAF